MGLLPGGVEGAPQELDLNTIELFTRFFSIEELIRDFDILHLEVRQLTILKAAILQELAQQIAQQPPLRSAVRNRVQQVATALRAASE